MKAVANNHHHHYTTSIGRDVPRVTEVIGFMSKDSIPRWANYLGFKHIRYDAELDRTANIGTAVHEVLESFNDPNRIASITDAMDFCKIYNWGDRVEVRNAIYSFFLWYRKHREKYHPVSFEETIVTHELGGTIDVVLNGLKDSNKVILGDYKTSSDIYFTQVLQLAAYCKLYEEKHGEGSVEGVVIFRLDKKNGNEAETYYLSRKLLDFYIPAFEYLLVAYQSINTLKNGNWKEWRKQNEMCN